MIKQLRIAWLTLLGLTEDEVLDRWKSKKEWKHAWPAPDNLILLQRPLHRRNYHRGVVMVDDAEPVWLERPRVSTGA
jgi:hypothetical protein